MSGSSLVLVIQRRLRVAGYTDFPTPFKVASVEFSFTAVMRGKDGRALDLILLIDTTTGDFGDRDAARVRQRVEALSRALDVTGSRYVVTVILAGAMLAESIEQLSETCRVLQVDAVALDPTGEPVDEKALRQLDDRIRVLLPLSLPEPLPANQDGNGPAMVQLVQAMPAGTSKSLLDAVIAGSEKGEEAVTDAAALVVSTAFAAADEGTTH